MTDDPLLAAARALMLAVQDDEERHGGTISRQTLQLVSLLRIQVDRADWLAQPVLPLAGEPTPDQRALGAAYQLAGQLVGAIEWPHLVPLLDMLSGDTARLDDTFAPAPVRLT
jgi:hypothetical protein